MDKKFDVIKFFTCLGLAAGVIQSISNVITTTDKLSKQLKIDKKGE